MRRIVLSLAVAIAVITAMVALAGSGGSANGQAAGEPRVVDVLGIAQVQGEDVFIHIRVVVPHGQDERQIAAAALREQGARPADPRDLLSANFATTGLVWDQFSDSDSSDDYVTQYYNPARDRTGGNGQAALTSTHTTWGSVATSSFAFQFGGQTNRCPSLVRECPGPQSFDGFNDVGWLRVGGGTTLAVTWYGTSTDEADMALNTKFAWHAGTTSCTDVSGKYDAQSVLLHENGHVVGLGHSAVGEAVMYAYYGAARCLLHQDDIDGISSLYPSGGTPPSSTPTPTSTPEPIDTPTATPTPETSATPEATPTATPTSEPSSNSVFSISLELAAKGPNYQAFAHVTVVDGSGNAVKQAPVSGEWTLNDSFLSDSFNTTNGRGVARLASEKASAASDDTFTISITEPGAGILSCSISVGTSSVTCP